MTKTEAKILLNIIKDDYKFYSELRRITLRQQNRLDKKIARIERLVEKLK